jgi:hypothetical protein
MRKNLNLDEMAFKHTNYVLSNENLFKNIHYSTVQYCNRDLCKRHNDMSKQVYAALRPIAKRNKTFLNFGMGPGFFENLIEAYGGYNLESVEWDEQEPNFRIIREHLDISINGKYICNDINLDNFNILNCNKRYDYVLLIRFFPLNAKHSDLNKVKNILNKLKKYADKAIILDNLEYNYNKDVIDYFNSISDKDYIKLDSRLTEYCILNL